MNTLEEFIAHRNNAIEVLSQVRDDIDDVVRTGDHALFYERMVANAESITNLLETE